ncbi:hypothetical protein Leryth_003304 [Lithospermum erythrorhizon]|nr:hypothetical protein Leryth_003304 [Lithospermum erythrorhizon]
MGGVFGGGGVGADTITSPQRAVIEKVQAELRQEYDVREERRRELEFLEKGGDPLEFKLSTASSLSLQSTSVTDQQPYKLVSSEAKGSFARAASPHGDSVESSGRPVVRLLSEPDSADNLMLFDGENEFAEVDRSVAHPSKCIFTPSKQSHKLDVHDNSKELRSSAAFNVPRNSYRRRSRPNRDGARTGSNHAVLARSTSLTSRHPPREVKGLSSDVEIQTDQTVLVNANPVPPSQKKGTASQSSENPSELNCLKAAESTANASKDLINDDNQKKFLIRRSPEIVHKDQECALKKKDMGSTVIECHPSEVITKPEDLATRGQNNGCDGSKDNMNDLCVDVQNSVAVASKVLDSESSCIDMGSNTDGCNGNELSTNQKGTGNVKEHMLVPKVTPVKEEATEIEERRSSQPLDRAVLCEDNNLNNQNQENELQCGAEKEGKINYFVLGNTLKDIVAVQSVQVDTAAYSETDIHVTGSGTAPSITNQESVKSSLVELPAPKLSIENLAVTMKKKESNAKAVSNADEDAVLKEAGVIEAKRKRIATLSTAVFPIENHRKSHWDYVIDEMQWLANDFAQERLWKMTAAAQICHRVAYNLQLRVEEKHRTREQKRVAHLLSEAVKQFWSSVQDSNKDMPLTCRKDSALTLRQYALNFLKFNSSCVQHHQAEVPETPDRNSDLGTLGISWNDNWTEGNLFYVVPSGAMKKYKKLIESHAAHNEKTYSSLQEDEETSALDTLTAFGACRSAYEEEQGETSTYGCNISKPSGYAQKKRKILPNGYGRRSYEAGADLMNTQCMENKVVIHQAVFMGKRPASSLNVSIPTKRVRTASRQRVLSPFTAGTSECVPLPSKADASSGDTSSFHDDQSTPYGESIMANNLEVESVRDFEKKLHFDSTEVSKPRKKKKPKKGSAYEQRWQIDSNFQSEQRENSKKRSEAHQLESNGCDGLLDQHILKKPKVKRPSALDNSFNNILPVAGSVPSPVASQMSNMSKLNIKIIGGGEQGRKTKASKVPSKQQGSGSPWSQFEDQALIVLVHDMGPNWELVSDAINFTLQFKCVYRKPNECKERHKVLMDKTTGDGTDSAEDSGSSQPYSYTLPGIPKGSARQLFQQLQRPMEEEILKSHFEKIIIVMQKQHYRKIQNGNHDLKQLQQPHGSHMLALSQVCPNNLNGGPALTPLDLCDQTTSDTDITSLGYQSPLDSCLPMSNQFSVASMPASQGPATPMLVGNNFSSLPGSLNPYVRDGRFSIPRSASLSIDEQHRMQHYNQVLPARSIQQPAPTTSEPGTERGMRMLPSGSGMSVTRGVNRSVHVARPGFQTMAPSATVNSGVGHSLGMVTMSSPVNMLSGSSSGQGNSDMSAHDALHMMRPRQSQETQRKVLAPEIQMRVPQANQGVPPYGGSTFPNQTGVPPMPVPSRSLHQQSLAVSSQQTQILNHRPHFQGANHASNPQQQAYALRLMKERQLQQRIMQQQHHQQQQQHHQFVSSNAAQPRAQQPTQLPASTSLPNTSQVRPQISSSPVPFSALAASSSLTSVPHQHKLQMPPHRLVRNSQTAGSGLANHIGKQRRQLQQQPQALQFQQAGRHHPEQRQQPLSQQHIKHVKGVGRENVIQQSPSTDSCLPNGLSTTPGNASSERCEQAMHSVQGQGSYSESALNLVRNTKKLVSPNSLSQSQPTCPGQVAQASNNIEIVASHSDNNSNLAPVSSVCHESVAPLDTTTSSSHQQPQLQLQSQQKAVNDNPSAPQNVLQANRQVNCDMRTKLQSGESPVEQCNISNTSHPASIELQEGNDVKEGAPVGSSSADQRNPSEQLHDSVMSTPSSFASAGTHLADDAGETVESLGCKQSSQQVPSLVSQPQQHTSPVSQLQQ